MQDAYGGDEFDEVDNQSEVSGTPGKFIKGRSYAEGRKKHNTGYVYGARSTASKTRRCGECEGCNREDCAECEACKDKPKFGGKGTKKQVSI